MGRGFGSYSLYSQSCDSEGRSYMIFEPAGEAAQEDFPILSAEPRVSALKVRALNLKPT